MKRVFVQLYNRQWNEVANLLKNELDYRIVDLHQEYGEAITNKWSLLKREIRNCLSLFRHRNNINHVEVCVIPGYSALFLLFLKRMHLLKVQVIVWYGMFIHNPKMINMLGKFIHILQPANEEFKVICFSKSEAHLYANNWHMSTEMFQYIPLGDWGGYQYDEEKCQDEGYFFSGGYSNRDHITVIESFLRKKERLVVIASKQNAELLEYLRQHEIPKNISVSLDVPTEEFQKSLEHAHAVILCMKHNTGASGQMVVLNAIKHKKPVIATKTDVLLEYLPNEEYGFLLENNSLLDDTISRIVDKDCTEMVKNAYERYKEYFCRDAIAEKVKDVFEGI